MALDQEKLNQFLQQALNDLGATFHASLIVLGDKLGLYKAMAGAGPLTSTELAQRAGVAERYVREWLAAQAASGYVAYDPTTGRFTLPEEQAFALANENSPAFLPGAFQLATAAIRIAPKLLEAFRTGAGVGWHEHDSELFHGTERFFRPGYAAHLTSSWLPALEGVEARLHAGVRVADVGCGRGASTILMAQAYPQSTFFGFDYHAPSIERARQAAHEAGVADRVTFEVAKAKDYPGAPYDFVAFFDCLHDMGDPVGTAAHVRETLRDDGVWMIVEPFAHDRLEDNLNPIGRMYYAASTQVCTPASLSQEVGLALGNQAGEARLREVVSAGGFTRFRRATETPFNLVFEARP
ncbi:MAG TPA: class I SAM-dependent methyltransferase [Methylomirabilota bacterium]|jgi:SAM-dependent methyltransferase|nr:class I SAM-dependent methyltransferase [Methylomirabilota bacterium]